MWLEIEKLYMPWRNGSNVPAVAEGRTWQFQRHIYETPFYYIDYALAQTCALQYWKWSENDRAAAFASYVKICDVGGSKPFLGIVEAGGLISPFKDGCLQSIVDYSYKWLNDNYPEQLATL